MPSLDACWVSVKQLKYYFLSQWQVVPRVNGAIFSCFLVSELIRIELVTEVFVQITINVNFTELY